MNTRFAFAMLLLASSGSVGSAQSIADRVKRAPDGAVRLTFATRPEYCGRGGSISRGGNWRNQVGDWDRSRDVEWDSSCDYGPGRLVLEKREGEIVSLRFYMGGRWRDRSDATDLGTVGSVSGSDVSRTSTVSTRPVLALITTAMTSNTLVSSGSVGGMRSPTVVFVRITSPFAVTA